MAEREKTNSNSLSVSGDGSLSVGTVEELLDIFIKNTYKAKAVDRRYEIIHKRCIHLFAKDYRIEILDNKQGQLCPHYPSELIVIEGHQHVQKSVNKVATLKEMISTAKLARCRSRFVMPVILFGNKNICRSATLSTTAELYGRSGVEWIFTGTGGGNACMTSCTPPEQVDSVPDGQRSAKACEADSPGSDGDWVLLTKVRGHDVRLLKTLDVSLICDLMVEKKKWKYGVYVSSSEKVDKLARYSDFYIASMPYPGCEFFKDYNENGFNPVSLVFNWNQFFIDAELSVPVCMEGAMPTPCSAYKSWDLKEITQNYFQMLLKYLLKGNGGILVHCISGWDRTPLFISLLRLSLWADGKIHQSLNPAEMLYLTLAYDWLLYGHQLKERREKGEEVMYFCFDFLKYIVSDEYSVNNRPGCEDAAHRYPNVPPYGLYDSDEMGTSAYVGTDKSWSDDDVSTKDQTSPHGTELLTISSMKKASQDSTDTYYTACSSLSMLRPATKGLSRVEKLNEVRELFVVAYKSQSPETPEQTTGTLAGFFSKVTGAFLNTSPAK